tara:strand:- start:5 stop:1198 length:1194 start_codon:yes stop_codon:yes gene_type:complete
MLVYVFEGIVRVFFKDSENLIEKNKKIRENRASSILDKYGIEIDTRSPVQVKKDLKKDGIDVSLLITPYRMIETEGIKHYDSKLNKIFPLAGLSKKFYVGGAESGEYKFYTTDRYGFNNLDDDWDKEIFITLIGDSFTHGGYLDFANNFTGVLKKISTKPVLALGQPNNGPLLELATLKEYAKKVNPSIILWMYYEGNDLIEIIDEKKSITLNKYFSENYSQNLINKQSLIDRSYSKFVEEKISKLDQKNNLENDQSDTSVLSVIKLQKIRRILFTKLFDKIRDRENTKSTQILSDVLVEAKRETDLLESKLYFVYLPSASRFLDGNKNVLKENDYFRKEVIDIVDELDIGFIDIYEELFKYHENPLSFYHFSMYSHYNKKAVEEISQEIYKQILNN